VLRRGSFGPCLPCCVRVMTAAGIMVDGVTEDEVRSQSG